MTKRLWSVLSTPIFEMSGTKISVVNFFVALAIFFLTIKVAKLVQSYASKVLDKYSIEPGVKGSIEKMIYYIMVVIGSFIALDSVGISLSSLAAVGAVLMVGIGFGLQNITQNFISGLIILFERPIKVGDLVEVNGINGRVVEIGIRSTLIHTRDDVAIIVPNSEFISKNVVNESFSGDKRRLHMPVGVAYGSEVELVKSVLEDIAKNHKMVLSHPEPKVLFNNFGDSSLDFDLTFWTKDNWYYEVVMSDLRYEIDRKFRENNISIPFPQRDVHIVSAPGPTSVTQEH